LVIIERFTFTIPTNKEVIYVGCGWSELVIGHGAKYLLDPNSGCPGDYERVLEAIHYESKIVWTKSGLTAIKVGVVFVWIAFFSLLALLIGTFLVFLLKSKPMRSTSSPPMAGHH
jgi:hypothetical protein